MTCQNIFWNHICRCSNKDRTCMLLNYLNILGKHHGQPCEFKNSWSSVMFARSIFFTRAWFTYCNSLTLRWLKKILFDRSVRFVNFLHICKKVRAQNLVKVIKIKTCPQIFNAYAAVISMRYKLSTAFTLHSVCDHPTVLPVSESSYFLYCKRRWGSNDENIHFMKSF